MLVTSIQLVERVVELFSVLADHRDEILLSLLSHEILLKYCTLDASLVLLVLRLLVIRGHISC